MLVTPGSTRVKWTLFLLLRVYTYRRLDCDLDFNLFTHGNQTLKSKEDQIFQWFPIYIQIHTAMISVFL